MVRPTTSVTSHPLQGRAAGVAFTCLAACNNPSSSARSSSRPFATTAAIRVVLAMAVNGSASSRTRSASLPTSIVPTSSPRPDALGGIARRGLQRFKGRESRLDQERQLVVEAEAGEEVRETDVGAGHQSHPRTLHRLGHGGSGLDELLRHREIFRRASGGTATSLGAPGGDDLRGHVAHVSDRLSALDHRQAPRCVPQSTSG